MPQRTPQCGIYGFRSLSTGRWYVGQSVDIESRRVSHLGELRANRHRNEYLQRAFSKYGEADFEFHFLESTSPSMLDVREVSWIQYHHSAEKTFGFNLTTGGNRRTRFSEESRKKIAEANSRREISESTRKKMSDARKGWKPSAAMCKRWRETWGKPGRSFSEETRRRMSLSAQNKPPVSVETRLKQSKARKGKKVSEETLRRRRGQKRSWSTRQLMSEAAQRRGPPSEETRKKMSESRRRRDITTPLSRDSRGRYAR